MKPQVWYFPIRGRAEPIKLALAAKGIDFEVCAVDYAEMKANRIKYPFHQCPRYVDEDGSVCQSNAILRHIGRKHGLMGASLADAAAIDMLVDGVEDLKRKYLALIYNDQLSEPAKTAAWETHCDPSTTGARNGGAHFAYLAHLAERCGGEGGWAVGSQLSIADILIFDIVDLFLRVYGEQFKAAYPGLAALRELVAGVPGVKAYLEGPWRLEKVNNNGLG